MSFWNPFSENKGEAGELNITGGDKRVSDYPSILLEP
jgi:hypothetical protein